MKSINFIIKLSTIFLLVSCGQSKNKISDEYEVVYSPKYSSGFNIKSDPGSDNVIITVLNPWQRAEDVSLEFIIDSSKKNESDKSLKGNKFAERIVCMSSTHVAMLDALGALDKIVAVSGKNYITNPNIRNNNDIPDIGYEGNIDYEKILEVNPDLVLLFSVNGASTMEPKLNELGIPYLYIGDYVEEDPLGKAEWIIPVAHVIGLQDKGIHYFDELSSRYNNLRDKIKTLNPERPKVMVNAPFLDSWFMPSSNSFVARLIEDAGGEYIYKKNTGSASMPIDLEDALSLVSEADFWINIGSVQSYKEFKETFPKFLNTTCVLNQNLFNNNLRTNPGGGNDCYESGAIHPDIILKDLIKIFHPEIIDEDFIYYHKLN